MKLLVCATEQQARDVAFLLKLDKSYKFTGVGARVAHKGYARIQVIAPAQEPTEKEITYYCDYLPQCLLPGGELRFLNMKHPGEKTK